MLTTLIVTAWLLPLLLLFVGAVSVEYALKSSLVEEITAGVPFINTGADSLTFDGLNKSGTLDSTTTPAVSAGAAFQKPLVAGAATIDLTALTHRGVAVDLTGKRLNIVHFRNPTTNTGNITVTFGAANPYLLLGAGWKVILAPGQQIVVYGDADTPLVAGGAKNVDLAGTGTEALDVIVCAG